MQPLKQEQGQCHPEGRQAGNREGRSEGQTQKQAREEEWQDCEKVNSMGVGQPLLGLESPELGLVSP